ncbi:hypothetical protein BGW80DRAFT_72613 [Lactifluus volemus]|nr:hypothetical protein BGW80DRAFT_72613 [Lactifluus volemus]
MSSRRARYGLSCYGVPHPNRVIMRARCDTLPIRRECNTKDLGVLCLNHHFQFRPMRQLPAFQPQCPRKLRKVLMKDLGRGWHERQVLLSSRPCASSLLLRCCSLAVRVVHCDHLFHLSTLVRFMERSHTRHLHTGLVVQPTHCQSRGIASTQCHQGHSGVAYRYRECPASEVFRHGEAVCGVSK